MAGRLETTSISAPGFQGLNTQDSSVNLDAGFATVANNCVIDKFGRIGARKGWVASHETIAALSTASVSALAELVAIDGTSYTIVAGNNKLFKLASGVLTELTYGGGGSAPTITASNWQMAGLAGVLYIYQLGHDPLVFDPATSTTTYRRVSEKTGYLGTVQSANCAISAYGRIWTANTTTNKSYIQFSDLLSGHVLTTGTAGYLDISEIWPNGSDEIVALAAHNGFLVIFGKTQVLVYSGANDPATMALQDTITGVGCLARDSVVRTGGDLLFLSDSGVKSLMRTIQEKSAPMRDISANVRDDLVNEVLLEDPDLIRAVYSDKDAFYLLSLPSRDEVYCFDMRSVLQNGSNRVTLWDNMSPTAFLYTRDKKLLMGFEGLVGEHTGYRDNGNTYTMRYYTNFFDFGAPTLVKIMKKVGITIIGGQGYPVILKFGYNYTDIYNSRNFTLSNAAVAEYNIAEYNEAEFGGSAFDNKIINVGGAGKIIQLGFETVVNNRPVSIQKIDVYVKTGRTR